MSIIQESIDAINAIVRPAVTLMLVIGLVWGFVSEKVGADVFVGIVGIVIGFWFREREEKKVEKEIKAAITEAKAESSAPAQVT